MKSLPLIALLCLTPSAFGQSISVESELAGLDAAATMLGSIRSWISNEPESAIHAFEQHEAIEKYVKQKRADFAGVSGNRLLDRMAQIDAGLKAWDDAIERLHRDGPKQITTELKRQSDAVTRYKNSKSPRPSSFAYIPKTVWKTKDKLDVLTASGFDTADLQTQQIQVQEQVLELVASLDEQQLAKKNGKVRDSYKRDDRPSIETLVRTTWMKNHPQQTIADVVMPAQSWSSTYSAKVDPKTGSITPHEVKRMTVYVATEKSDEILTLHPIRLRREGNTLQQIPTNEFPFDVLRN